MKCTYQFCCNGDLKKRWNDWWKQQQIKYPNTSTILCLYIVLKRVISQSPKPSTLSLNIDLLLVKQIVDL